MKHSLFVCACSDCRLKFKIEIRPWPNLISYFLRYCIVHNNYCIAMPTEADQWKAFIVHILLVTTCWLVMSCTLKTFRFSYDLTIETTLRALTVVIKGTEKKLKKKSLVLGTVTVLLIARVDTIIVGTSGG